MGLLITREVTSLKDWEHQFEFLNSFSRVGGYQILLEFSNRDYDLLRRIVEED